MTVSRDQIEREIAVLRDRAILTLDTVESFQSSVESLVHQDVSDDIIEENRDKASIYYEVYLDIVIKIGRLSRQLANYTE